MGVSPVREEDPWECQYVFNPRTEGAPEKVYAGPVRACCAGDQ
ncbi:MAG: hypothetical protein ACP5C4_09535 [Methanomicrobiales archaeon]